MPLHLPEAEDIRANDIRPAGVLRDSSADLGAGAELQRRYEEDGYLFLRGVLPRDAVEAARGEMMRPLLERGLIDADGVWIGGDRPTGLGETSPEFAGIWQRLFARPSVRSVLEKLLGERPTTVPIVQYRAYQPGPAPAAFVHQDGYYSPGIQGYRPIWIPLADMEGGMGGLALAKGFTGRDFIHNTAKGPSAPIPAGIIRNDAWLSTDFRMTDILVIHPKTPHVGLVNRSKRVRFSIDTRVESAANPCTLMGEVVDAGTDYVTLRSLNGKATTLRVDADTYLRTGPSPGSRLSPEEFITYTPPGLSVVVSREGDRALMVRRAAAG